jgi:hypothetical protein
MVSSKSVLLEIFFLLSFACLIPKTITLSPPFLVFFFARCQKMMKSLSTLHNITDVLDSHFTIFASPFMTYSEALFLSQESQMHLHIV